MLAPLAAAAVQPLLVDLDGVVARRGAAAAELPHALAGDKVAAEADDAAAERPEDQVHVRHEETLNQSLGGERIFLHRLLAPRNPLDPPSRKQFSQAVASP